jgi:hypothetical protein
MLFVLPGPTVSGLRLPTSETLNVRSAARATPPAPLTPSKPPAPAKMAATAALVATPIALRLANLTPLRIESTISRHGSDG